MKPNKHSSRLLALALSLVLSLSLSLPALAAGEDGIIYIHTAKDLCALSDSCAYDAWSRGKTVLLTADISLRLPAGNWRVMSLNPDGTVKHTENAVWRNGTLQFRANTGNTLVYHIVKQ